MADHGFIYFLSNESMPGIYKIGFTAGHPEKRIEQLSAATACPTAFELLACFGIESPSVVEREIHARLKDYRVNSSREFFQVSASQLMAIVDRYTDPSDLRTISNLQALEYYEQLDEDIAFKKNHFYSQNCDPMFWVRRGFGFGD